MALGLGVALKQLPSTARPNCARGGCRRQDYGWTISSQRGGPGGCPFDDCQHLERATGGCADEWVLCEVEIFWWAAAPRRSARRGA